MTDNNHTWTDNPMKTGISPCEPDIVNENLMYLKEATDKNAKGVTNLGTSLTEVEESVETLTNKVNTLETTIPETYATKEITNQLEAKVTSLTTEQNSINNKLPVQNMYETGFISTDTQGYNQLLSMKHSTFDKSKFTIVGNPTITDDGVVNGISTSNYININNSITPTASIKVIGDFVYSTKPNEANGVKVLFNLFDSILGVEHALRPVIANDSLLRLDKSNGATISALNVKLPTLVNGDMLHIEFELTSTKCTLTGYVNGVKYANSVEHSQPFYKIESILVGHNNKNGGIYYFTGSIDLSKFFIIVDGKEVFNGNKTGIDTIKANNYEVVGSPVITDDGIVSGFSGSDYLKTTSFSFSNYWKFNCKFNIKNIPDTLFPFLQLSSFNRILLQNSGNIRIFADENNNTGHFVDLFGINTIQTNTNYDLEISYNNNLYYGKLTNLDNNSIVTSTVTSMYYFPTDSSNWSIGSDDSRYIDGSLDLNSFKIYVDNNLVYQPCLKIPYTQSKTGSKIVDGGYRDRVQDLYEQTGVAPYYTIDETNQNFTLPMGEIYGMIEKKATVSSARKLVEISDKSILPSWYKVFEEYDPVTGEYIGKWCEQGGIFRGMSTNFYSVNLIKPYVDNNYLISVSGFGATSTAVLGISTDIQYISRTVAKFDVACSTRIANDSEYGIYWQASGYIA